MSHGYEAHIFEGTFVDCNGKTWELVVKKFRPASKIEIERNEFGISVQLARRGRMLKAARMSESESEKAIADYEKEIREKQKDDIVKRCRFISETATKFRAEGLPVLPMVKSVVTEKDLIGLDENLIDEVREFKPPFVVMTKLGKTGETFSLYNGAPDKFYSEIASQPELLEGMVTDVAHLHELGYAMGRLKDRTRHPVFTLWLFTRHAGKTERYLVDLSNLYGGEGSRITREKDDEIDLFGLIKEIDIKADIEHYREIYNRARLEKREKLEKRK